MARPLKMFMRGKRITLLQQFLGRMGYPMLDQSGQFGPSTRDAVKSFQTQRGLKATGLVDDNLFQLIQQGQLADSAKAKTADAEKTAPIQAPANQQQLDAIIRLLIQKGILSQEELQQEISRPQPARVTQPPLVP